MRIVQIEDFFHPDAGYQVNVLSKYFARKNNEVIIVTAELSKMPDHLTAFFGKDNIEERDRVYSQKYGVKIIRIPVKKYISGRVWYDNSIFKTVEGLQPDIVYVHGNDTLIAIQYFLRAKKLKFPVISDSHMLEMASQNKFNKLFRKFYRKVVTPRIIKNDITVIRAQDDPYVEKCLGIPLERCPWVSFGSDTMLFHPDSDVKEKFRKDNAIDLNDFVVVYAGKLDEAKGGALLAEAFENRFSVNRNVVLIAVGNTVGEYGEKVEKLFSGSGNRVLRFPSQKYSDLPVFYQAADIAVFPRQCSLSFFDVQACGLPVVSEDNDINVNRCVNHNGACFKAGSVEDFREKMEAFAVMDNGDFQCYKDRSIEYIRREYDYEKISDRYLELISAAYENFEVKP